MKDNTRRLIYAYLRQSEINRILGLSPTRLVPVNDVFVFIKDYVPPAFLATVEDYLWELDPIELSQDDLQLVRAVRLIFDFIVSVQGMLFEFNTLVSRQIAGEDVGEDITNALVTFLTTLGLADETVVSLKRIFEVGGIAGKLCTMQDMILAKTVEVLVALQNMEKDHQEFLLNCLDEGSHEIQLRVDETMVYDVLNELKYLDKPLDTVSPADIRNIVKKIRPF